MNNQPTFFDYAAEVELTKHLGGLAATDALAGYCLIGPQAYVLDVGCGAGVTPCYLARKYGCRVVGVDILPRMVERSRERAARLGLATRVEFKAADAQALPFEDDRFDAVITESVTAFPEDKPKAVGEYARVTRPGGYVGLNEATWLKFPPPPEIAAWASQDLGAAVKPLTPEEWSGLLETAGLSDIVTEIYPVNLQVESKGILQRYGWGGMLGVIGRMLRLYLSSPAYRKFVREVRQGGLTPQNLEAYFGYGLFVGRKPAR